MMDLRDPIELAAAVASALKRAGEPYALYGGLAVAAWGEPRETRDADFAVLGFSTEKAAAVLGGMRLTIHLSFQDHEFGGLLVSRTRVWFPRKPSRANTVDWVRPQHEPYARAALKRASIAKIHRRTLTILAPEDVILFKVLYTRDLDVEDAAGVFRRNVGRLDLALIASAARSLARVSRHHDIQGRLRSARKRATGNG